MADSNDKLFVCVSGVTSSDADQDIIDSLKKYGPVAGIRRGPNTGGSGEETVIVEFKSGATRANVEPLLPMEVVNVTNPNVKWHVGHVPTLTSSADQTTAVLSASSTDSCGSSDSDDGAHSDNNATPLMPRSKKKSEHSKPLPPFTPTTARNPTSSSTVKRKYNVHTKNPTSPNLSDEVTNPPEIQRVVVEHVIKSQPSNSKWMRTFSGKIPKPPGEADYETWSLHAELMFNDDSLSVDVQRKKILESLLPPASDVVRQLGTSAHPRHYVQLLDSAYGLVEDGEEVFARFLNTNQNSGEKASDYLQQLQSLLCTAVKRGGVKQVNADRHLLKQFKRGCWDHSLVLQLELKNETPPNFAEMLLQVRTEENRRASKHDRMQHHFGSSKTKPSVNIHSVPDTSLCDSNASLLQAYISETESLRKQVAQLQMQLNSKKYKKDKKQESKGVVSTNNSPPPVAEAQAHHVMPQNPPTSRPQPKAWFCFKCGEDGHIARNCDKPMNKALVDQKYTELRHKQDEWKARQPLNWTGFQ
ncbi:zinc finger CCHC domain-containing protein 12-like [Trachinotus anak]|uniref:zinc finger CCHC domain-containing protein 12-like n=1 Tax=Trachinotus anak TaxID=443729 RepID=UPI0039F1FCDF